jgi:hypothetical protein
MNKGMHEWMNQNFSCIYGMNFLLRCSVNNKTMPIGVYVIMIWKFTWIVILSFALKFSIQQTLNVDNFMCSSDIDISEFKEVILDNICTISMKYI